MKNIENGSIKQLILLIAFVAVLDLILYPGFDYVICRFITHSEFIYSIREYVIQPIIFACIFGVTYWLVIRSKKNK